jgi:hypothetical protein
MYILYKQILTNLTYILCLSVYQSLCLYPINFKTAEPIGPKFCVGVWMLKSAKKCLQKVILILFNTFCKKVAHAVSPEVKPFHSI